MVKEVIGPWIKGKKYEGKGMECVVQIVCEDNLGRDVEEGDDRLYQKVYAAVFPSSSSSSAGGGEGGVNFFSLVLRTSPAFFSVFLRL